MGVFIHLLAGVHAAVVAWYGLNVRTVFLSEKHVSKPFGKLHLKEFGIPRPKSLTSCGQAWPMSSPRSQAAPKASAKAASKAKAGRWEIRKRGPLGASGSTTWFTRESQRAHGDISFHSTKSTQGLTGSKRKNLSAFSNIPVGHCSCEVPKRKKEKTWMRKMRLWFGRFLAALLAGISAEAVAWC